jgi:hypothetical protein
VEEIKCKIDPNNVIFSNFEPDIVPNLPISKDLRFFMLPNSLGIGPPNELPAAKTVEEITCKTDRNDIIVSNSELHNMVANLLSRRVSRFVILPNSLGMGPVN